MSAAGRGAERIAGLRDRCRRLAGELRREVECGVAVRQSEEAKLARAQVLETVASELDRALVELGVQR